MDTIEKLRLGTQLHELDDEFAEDYIAEIKNRTINEVYISCDEDISRFRQFVQKHHSLILDLKTNVDGIEANKDLLQEQFDKETVDISKLIDEFDLEAERTINLLYEERLQEVLETHHAAFQAHKSLANMTLKMRKRTIITWALLTGFIATMVYASLRYWDVINPSTIFSDISIGLTSTAIGNLTGYLVGKFKVDIKRLTAETKFEYITEARHKLMQLFGESFWDYLIKNSIEDRTGKTTPFFKDMFIAKISPAVRRIDEANQVVLDRLLEENGKLTSQISAYQMQAEQFHTKFCPVFTEVEKNLDKIRVITKQIKEVAIKPSFELLSETAENLEKVKQKIQSL